MFTRFRFLAAALPLVCTAPLLAQVAPPAPIELEGPIEVIDCGGDGNCTTGGRITVMGIVVEIPAATPIHTPTRDITMAQLADPTSLPGRSELGFIGGTAIILGTSDGMINTAEDVFTEPAENVVLGLITSSNCQPPRPGHAQGRNDPRARLCTNNSIAALGTATLRLTNRNTAGRMPAIHPSNELGFEINLYETQEADQLTDAAVGLEGYFDGQRLNWFVLELGGTGQLRNPDRSEVSVLRAQCRERPGRGIELDIMGSVHRAGTLVPQTFPDPTVGANGTTPTTVRVRVPGGAFFPVVNGDGDPIDVVTAVLDEVTDSPNGFGEYDYALSDDPDFDVCPDTVRVIYTIQGETNAATNAAVDVRL